MVLEDIELAWQWHHSGYNRDYPEPCLILTLTHSDVELDRHSSRYKSQSPHYMLTTSVGPAPTILHKHPPAGHPIPPNKAQQKNPAALPTIQTSHSGDIRERGGIKFPPFRIQRDRYAFLRKTGY
ncbi:hypothetical protein Bbelb_221700 [Branchiostoma belcheri]|nr:hypothetical protein Bbelb_221700 [Branchiostoma belcheri]